MRGTSTDVKRYNKEYEHVFKSTTAGVTIQAPQLLQIKVDVQNLEKDDLSHLFFLTATQSQHGLVYAIIPVGFVCRQPGSSLNLLGPIQASHASVRGFPNCDANLCLEMLLPEQMLYDRLTICSFKCNAVTS
ncbi:unnamed protein product [Clavelina lepadiformis]|uniref:Uncharacterized protein n=1 Tax=Clavelina lepadiformis TaxID=159417 RepID=A0ABP0G6V9_CLALP